MDAARFRKRPVFGILRGIAPDILEPLLETLLAAGLDTVEITMNTPDAAGLIRRAAAFAPKRLTVGAGTVLDAKNYQTARDAGASFIVMPTLEADVMARCVQDGVPAFPGALTPTEIYRAWRAGATMVKVFPSDVFGPAYFKALKGPFRDVELLACGGVTPENIKEYFAAGAAAVSFGAGIFRKEWLARGDFKSIGEALRRFLAALPG
ncbi:MAG: bifunctional 4-hydroxy-2-oxoglutarate aldolase/2-dehydro-3-deoxy-phosphogluconate aldolase [Deltaproteobacteria bacterium]